MKLAINQSINQSTLQVQGGGTYLSKCNVPTSAKAGELLLNSSRDVK